MQLVAKEINDGANHNDDDANHNDVFAGLLIHLTKEQSANLLLYNGKISRQ